MMTWAILVNLEVSALLARKTNVANIWNLMFGIQVWSFNQVKLSSAPNNILRRFKMLPAGEVVMRFGLTPLPSKIKIKIWLLI